MRSTRQDSGRGGTMLIASMRSTRVDIDTRTLPTQEPREGERESITEAVVVVSGKRARERKHSNQLMVMVIEVAVDT